ncbi:hypothetical protein IJ670_03580, partial [bacterium]|nr:hypothetical protein [bacterium]
LLIRKNEQTKQDNVTSKNSSIVFLPIALLTSFLTLGSFVLSNIFKKSSSSLLNSKTFEQLPDIATNMNIKEEPQFAIYSAIRNPDFPHIMACCAVFLMSGITIGAKNFVDGMKDIWVNRNKADIEENLQQNLIDVEKKSFSGKLDVINKMLTDNIRYFDSSINKNQNPTFGLYSQFINFKGNEENKNKEKNKNLMYWALSASVVALCVLFGKLSLDNLKSSYNNTKDFADNFQSSVIDAINKITQKPDKSNLSTVKELLGVVGAKEQYIQEVANKYGLSKAETQKMVDEVDASKKRIFADAPLALGGVPKKIQYYCYMDENRGHLYNWVLNPKNKFTKYIFLAFTLTSAFGYTFKQAMDAFKQVAVMKENSACELNLRKKLVEVEIENFKAKKESAINPLIEQFGLYLQDEGKSKEELKTFADNILLEIKNGPPYVYA